MTDSTHRDPARPDFLNPAASVRVAAAARRWKLLAGGTVALGIAARRSHDENRPVRLDEIKA